MITTLKIILIFSLLLYPDKSPLADNEIDLRIKSAVELVGKMEICFTSKIRDTVKLMVKPGASVQASVISLKDFGYWLSKISENKAAVQETLFLIEQMREKALWANYPIIAPIMRHYTQSLSKEEKTDILVCIVSSAQCVKYGARAAVSAHSEGISVVDFREVDSELVSVDAFLRQTNAELPFHFNKDIFMTLRALDEHRPEDYRLADQEAIYASFFIHEYNHVVDYELVQRWIEANQKLILRGQKPDSLFSKYVRVVRVENSYKLIIDKSFMNLFTEGRSTWAQDYVGQVLSNKYVQDLASTYFKQYVLEADPKVVEDLFSQSETKWETVIRLGQMMEETVRLAGLRLPY